MDTEGAEGTIMEGTIKEDIKEDTIIERIKEETIREGIMVGTIDQDMVNSKAGWANKGYFSCFTSHRTSNNLH